MPWLSVEEFKLIYDRVPRLCVDVLVPTIHERGCVLARRSMEPYIGHWELPGGGVLKGETLEQTAARITKRELGIMHDRFRFVGIIEQLHEPRPGAGVASMHCVDVVMSPLLDDAFLQNVWREFTPAPGEGTARWWVDQAPPQSEWQPYHIPWLLERGFFRGA
jgi:ADP-ribose pyrophosphatase YjhB (NUDIX family)